MKWDRTCVPHPHPPTPLPTPRSTLEKEVAGLIMDGKVQVKLMCGMMTGVGNQRAWGRQP